MKFNKQAKALATNLAAVVAVSVIASPVFAAVDTTEVTTAIGDAKTAVGVVGGAVLGVIVLVALYKWLRRPIS